MTKLGLLLLVGLLFVGCSNQPATILVNGTGFDIDQIAQGQQLYSQYCSSCHGVNGEGQFPSAPTERDATGRFGAPPHNGNGHTWHHGDAMLIEYVRNGGISLSDPVNWYPMPAFGEQLTNDQVMVILAYIKTFWSNEQRARQAEITAAENGVRTNPFQVNPGS
ncbi:MAG: cytochrome c [Anaerolineae bacterium]|nr:cytochrome c [Anaerolineae bacterium]